jgi:hypothetical protein
LSDRANADSTEERKAAGFVRGISDGWQNFIICVILHLGLPLLPIALEAWFAGQVEAKSAALTAALYSMAIGLSSRSVALFGFGILMCVLFSAAFGFLSRQSTLAGAEVASYLGILVIFIVHAVERYNRHVVDRIPFLKFANGE